MSHNPFPVPGRYLEPAAVEARGRYHPAIKSHATKPLASAGLLITGPTGTGKSLFAAELAERLRVKTTDTWVKWVRADKLSRILSERGGSEQISLLEEARVLVLDELGYERYPELVLEVIGDRHDHNRPTIVTSGLTVAKIMERYSDATVRRIIEVGGGCVVDCWAKQERK